MMRSTMLALVVLAASSPALAIRLGPRAVAERHGPLPADAPTPPVNTSAPIHTNAPTNASATNATTAAEDSANALIASLTKKEDSLKAPAAPNSTAPATKHAKLDVGFAGFEADLDQMLTSGVASQVVGESWDANSRSELEQNITSSMKDGLKAAFKPLKGSIGKTWVALKTDEQKDQYVSQLHSAFLPVFASSMDTISSHLNRTLARVSSKKEAQAKLLEDAEKSISESLLTQHCYDMPASKMKEGSEKQFCVNSVIGALAHRLNDTQGLISMTMRFEAGAMSLSQLKAMQGVASMR